MYLDKKKEEKGEWEIVNFGFCDSFDKTRCFKQ